MLRYHTLTHPKRKGLRPDRNRVALRSVRSGSTPDVTVTVDPALGPQGQQLAGEVKDLVQGVYEDLYKLFHPALRPHVTCTIAQLSQESDGTGGAYHLSCSDTNLVCDAAFGQAERTAALFAAELTEVFEAIQNQGWDCGNTNGESLSRALAEELFPGVLDDYSTAAAWLDGGRPDYINIQEGDDLDMQSNGCGTLFLNWLRTEHGLSWEEIIAAASTNLAGTYFNLGLGTDAYGDFRKAVDAAWPEGQPSGVMTDNPWGGITPPPPEPSPEPAPAPTPSPEPEPCHQVVTLALSADLPAGTYSLALPSLRKAIAGPKHLVLPGGVKLALEVAWDILQQFISKLLEAGQQQQTKPAAGK